MSDWWALAQIKGVANYAHLLERNGNGVGNGSSLTLCGEYGRAIEQFGVGQTINACPRCLAVRESNARKRRAAEKKKAKR